MKRLLVTGSRHWTDIDTIDKALEHWYLRLSADGEDVMLVHGECHLGGADIIARDIWLAHGLRDEPHPAKIIRGRVHGPERNALMVGLGADVCLAFPLPDSRGTYDCIRRATSAQIPVHIYEPSSDGGPR